MKTPARFITRTWCAVIWMTPPASARFIRTAFKKYLGCTVLTPGTVNDYHWLPHTCAYRTLAEGRPLADWHPLRSGNPESVHEVGVSIRHKVIHENRVAEEDWEEHIIHWVL